MNSIVKATGGVENKAHQIRLTPDAVFPSPPADNSANNSQPRKGKQMQSRLRIHAIPEYIRKDDKPRSTQRGRLMRKIRDAGASSVFVSGQSGMLFQL